MDREKAYKIFGEMISSAKREVVDFTLNHKFDVEKKADKTSVTACDKHIDKVLSDYAKSQGLSVISEEGDQENEIVKSGNYITIDPIDGSLGYIDHVNFALSLGNIKTFLKTDLGAQADFCLLLGIVENSEPKYGCCYHYVTGEKIMLDASDKQACYVELEYRKRIYTNACYIDQRAGESIEKSILSQGNVKGILQATLGLKSLYTFLNQHNNALTIHRVQHAGLWDILPAAVASKAFSGILLDDEGNEVVYNKYVILPGKGATAIKGESFLSVQNKLRTIPNENK
jgi:fructose-1,6-bisphosphatase/inositol monophosphatase family enzyme